MMNKQDVRMKQPDKRRLTGQQGEDLAAQYIIQQGYQIIERNWRCRRGELDIIARKDGILIIIEVRSRKSLVSFGHPVESVERRKQDKVRKIAEIYVTLSGQSSSRVRFDVITVLLTKDGLLQEINHIPNAF